MPAQKGSGSNKRIVAPKKHNLTYRRSVRLFFNIAENLLVQEDEVETWLCLPSLTFVLGSRRQPCMQIDKIICAILPIFRFRPAGASK